MKRLTFTIYLPATAEKVWSSLWQIENYKKWTTSFCEGTYYKTDHFIQGSKIHFLSPSGAGMYSIIDTLIENKWIVFKHIGELNNFTEQPLNEKTKLWTNAIESYELIQEENGITLTVQVDITEEYADYMSTSFPLALKELKKIVTN